MAITEIALLRLSASLSIDNVELRSKLAHAKKVMQDYTSRTFYYFQQVEDPGYIYIVGEWDSLDQHMNDFIPSRANQALLESLKDLLTVEWLQHIDEPHANLPLHKDGNASGDGNGNVLGVGRHFIKTGEKVMFQETFEANKHHLYNFVTEGIAGGGWRIDKEGDAEEWVLLCPWKDVEQHGAFAKTDGFKKYFQITEHISGAEIKHARLLDL